MMKLQWMHFRDRCINYTMKEVITETIFLIDGPNSQI